MPLDPAGTGAPQTFLRAPPFPWLRPDVAAVAVAPGQGARPSASDARAAFDAIRTARVGGGFWDPTSDIWQPAGSAEVGANGPDDERAFAALLSESPVVDRAGRPVEPADIEQALIAALTAVGYRNPFSGKSATLGETVVLLAEWRRMLDANRGIVACAGMAPWKRGTIARFLWDGNDSPPALPEAAALASVARNGGEVAYWPSRVADDFPGAVGRAGGRAVAVEDGFIRSEGLGADCRIPYSVTVDHDGVYYDPTVATELEAILAAHAFPEALLARAAALRARILATGVTKYGIARPAEAALPQGRRVVLAIGQVDDDLSVRRAGAGIPGNAAFLARVRAEEPDAYIIYRPHPDVLAGHRAGHVPASVAASLVDEVRSGGPLLPLVEGVDAIHVLSSLTGFEALLRGREVVTHGQPFYAGWGLTRDLAPALPRRGRQLSIDQLVAGTLILYPRYLDPVTGLPCGPEVLVERMAAGAAAADSLLTRARKAQGALRRGATLLREALS